MAITVTDEQLAAQELLKTILKLGIKYRETASCTYRGTPVEVALIPDLINSQAYFLISLERKPKGTGNDVVTLRYNTKSKQLLHHRCNCLTNRVEDELLRGINLLVSSINAWVIK